MNSAEFNAFPKYTDITLKRMTKDELIDYVHALYHNWKVADEQLERMIENLEELKNTARGESK